MMMKVLVYIDHHAGAITPATWEALGAGRKLSQDLQIPMEALVLGNNTASLASAVAEKSGVHVHAAEDASLEHFRADVYASAAAPLAEGTEVVLLPDNGRTREFAAMLAVDLNVGLIPDVVALDVRDGNLQAARAIYSGKVRSTVLGTGRKPIILTLRSRVFAPDAEQTGPGEIESVAVASVPSGVEVLGFEESRGGANLADAAVIVAGGRGVVNNPALDPPPSITDQDAIDAWRAEQGFAELQTLADAIGAALGATRAVVDAGFIPYAHQIGQTGKVVSPDLYIAFGISGAIQHLAGIRSARTVVAVNKDPDAPIFRSARFGLVTDMHEVIPALTKAFLEAS